MSSGERKAYSTRCDSEIWESARSAVQGMLRVDPGFTLSDLVEAAIAAEVERLQIEHNDGQPWPPATALRRGRRVS